MQRHQLEHIIRAASAITGSPEIVVVGSQAVLGPFPDAPADLLNSIEVDVFSFRGAADGDLIDGSIGEGSPFHQTFGYYAHGVGADTAVLPDGWKERLIPVRNQNTGSGVGLCLDVHDLAISKLVAGREKDIAFISSLLRNRLASTHLLQQRLAITAITSESLSRCEARLARIVSQTCVQHSQ